MRAIFAALAALAAAVLPAAGQEHDALGPSLTVIGEAETSAVPDMAVVTLGVMREAETAAGALGADNAATSAVIDAVKAMGIEARDMQTSGLTLNPRYATPQPGRGSPRIVGYTASNQLTVRIRDLTKLGALLDRAVSAGANDIRGISFDISDRSGRLDEARRRAVADARRKAELYAQAAGVRLGPLLGLDEEGLPGPRPMAARVLAAAPPQAVPVETGEVVLALRLRTVWKLLE